DQAFQEVALQGHAVRLCLDRAGLVGGDGAVHHGFCDLSMLRVFPGAALTAAIDEPSLRAAMEFMRTYDAGLSAVRYPRDDVSDRFAADCPPFELGRARPLITHDAPDLAILGYGVMAIEAAAAIDRLEGEYKIDLYDARFAKPVDLDLIRALVDRNVPILTVEDHGLEAGFGSCVTDACLDAGIDPRRITRLGIPGRWIYQASRRAQLEECGLDAASIARTVRTILDGHATIETTAPAARVNERTTAESVNRAP
ncbi:MAG: hypothetical protein KDA25_10410, partial [Phycisphaerales bacterium]|nr:hypothetical protein [Phycisphaerales bacterium]